MTRNQIFTTLEFINDTVRMVIGEYYNDKFYVYDIYESICAGLNNGNITNENIVIETIKQIRDDIHVKHDIMIEDVILLLPSNQLEILAFTSSSPVTGKNSLISQQDINDAYKVACKVRHDENKKIINVVPVEYYLDSGERMEFAPIRYKSSTFKTLFNVLLLPLELFDQYISIVTSCNLRVSNYFLDNQCLYAGIFDEGEINCAIINLNKYSSSMTIFKRGKLLNHYNYNRGSSKIENGLINKYRVMDADVDNLLYTLGNADINNSNRRAIYKSDEYEDYKYLTQYQLDEMIFTTYQEIFNNIIDNNANVLDKNIYDIYLSGKASQIKNIDKLFTSLSNSNSSVVVPNQLCLSNPSFLQTVGLIRLNYKKLMENKVILENNQLLVETRESKFDKFILDENELN